MPDLGRRTLRSGKEFSSYDLAVGAPLEPAAFFDVEECLPHDVLIDEPLPVPGEPIQTTAFCVNLAPQPTTSIPTPSTSSAPSALKLGSKRRRQERRNAASPLSTDTVPAVGVKSAAVKHRESALKQTIKVELDASELSHSKPAWIGLRSAEGQHENGMGGRSYTKEEIEALTGTSDLRYINWLGRISLPIVDSKGRIIAVLGGMPADTVGWKRVTDSAAQMLAERVVEGSFTTDQLYHRRAQEPYPSLSRGISHGGGQGEPGELCNNDANTLLTDDFLRAECFQRLAGFANCLFALFAPILFAFYQAQMALIAAWRPTLRWNFARSVFAACTFNFGPHAITVPHLDFGNLSWGWCAITALGWFNPDLGGHLILWDLKLVIRFPPGSTILLPSAIIRHSNVPVAAHERRYSFTQYTAGGLFRWIRNGFQTEEAFEKSATKTAKAARDAAAATRWAEGVAMFSTVDSLKK
ncbi:hypothetical protein C8R43DRAFT_1122461 [Mycena crocata]|nr:hypothetical protein C8R43DRAFT_1122461 [Mycena crocata]